MQFSTEMHRNAVVDPIQKLFSPFQVLICHYYYNFFVRESYPALSRATGLPTCVPLHLHPLHPPSEWRSRSIKMCQFRFGIPVEPFTSCTLFNVCTVFTSYTLFNFNLIPALCSLLAHCSPTGTALCSLIAQ